MLYWWLMYNIFISINSLPVSFCSMYNYFTLFLLPPSSNSLCYRDWQLVNGLQHESLHVGCFILPPQVPQRCWRQNCGQYTVNCVRMTCLWLGGLLQQIWENFLQLLNLLIWKLTSCQCLRILHRMVIKYLVNIWNGSSFFFFWTFSLECCSSWFYLDSFIFCICHHHWL